MATMGTGTAGLSDTMKTFYSRMLLEAAEPSLLHNMFGAQGRFQPGSGKVIEWRKFAALPTKTGNLTEGVTPTEDDLSISAITATAGQVGAFVKMTDLLTLTAFDPMLAETVRLQGDQAGRTYDSMIRDTLNGGTVVQYVGQVDRASITSTDVMTLAEIKKAVKTLENANARPFASQGGRFVVLVHPDVKFDITNDSRWDSVVESNTSDPENRFSQYLIGSAYNCVFYRSTNCKIWADAGAASADVYGTVVLGEGAYGVYTLQDLEYIVKPLGSGGTNDPLDLVQTAGWKGSFATKILHDEFMVRIESAATA